MAFRKIGNIYVSKAGNDSNPGTATQPVLTIGKAISLVATQNRTIVVGTGTYQEAFSTAATTTNLIADGVVVLKGDGVQTLGISYATGFKIQDYASVHNGQYSTETWQDIDFFNIPSVNPAYQSTLAVIRCKFINCEITSGGGIKISQSILVNTSTAPCVLELGSTYSNGASTIRLANNAKISNCNMMGNMSYVSGANAGVEMSLEAFKAAYPGMADTCFNQDPLFNNAAKQDFTLQAGSPHIQSGGSTNIGGTSFAKSITVADAVTNGAALLNLELQGQDLVIKTGYNSGSITFPPQAIAANPQSINRIDFSGLLLFDKAMPGGTDTNKYVPDAQVYNVGDGGSGDNPDRMVIEIRTCTSLAAPVSDADYDNNGYAPAGTYIKVPINEQPFIDNFGRGSGEPDFDVTAYQPVVAIWVQPKVTLTNAYN